MIFFTEFSIYLELTQKNSSIININALLAHPFISNHCRHPPHSPTDPSCKAINPWSLEGRTRNYHQHPSKSNRYPTGSIAPAKQVRVA
jgi:hypothetical protein